MAFHEEDREEIAVVKEVRRDGVVIEIAKGGGCDSCAISGVCMGKDNIVTHFVYTDRKLNVGDRVRFEVNPATRIGSAALLFLFPLVMLVAFYLLAKYVVGWSENISIISSFGGLLLSGLIIWRFDRMLGHKINFEIVEVLTD